MRVRARARARPLTDQPSLSLQTHTGTPHVHCDHSAVPTFLKNTGAALENLTIGAVTVKCGFFLIFFFLLQKLKTSGPRSNWQATAAMTTRPEWSRGCGLPKAVYDALRPPGTFFGIESSWGGRKSG